MNPIFLDTVPLIQAVSNLLDSGDDVQTIERILRTDNDVKAMRAKQQAEIKETIAAFSQKTAKVSQEQQKIETKVNATKQSVAESERDAENAMNQLNKAKEELEINQARIHGLDTEIKRGEGQLKKMENSEATVAPKISHALNLYSNISNIRWNFESKSRTKGFIVVRDEQEPLRPFDFDHASMTQFEICNRLWDLLE